jgi:predicted dehydrogenase
MSFASWSVERMNESICRWGILGGAGIARKNWRSIRNAGNATLTAVASREQARAEAFIRECQADVSFPNVPAAVGGYDKLLERDDVDAVYIPLPTGLRKEWVIRAAEAGKHVMCEKPCALNASDLREMIGACRRNNVQFMDGVMFMHSGRLEQVRHVLNDGASIGEVRRIHSHFSFRAADEFLKENIRVSSELEPYGCLGDLGWYNARFALWVMEGRLPHKVTGQMLASHGRADSPQPVPTEFSAELFFDGGVTSGFFCSFLSAHQQHATVSGSKGWLHIDDFVLPFHGSEVGFLVENSQMAFRVCDFTMERHPRRLAVSEYSHGHPTAQETGLFRTFSELVLSGKRDAYWPEIALKTQQVLDACLESSRRGGAAVDLS